MPRMIPPRNPTTTVFQNLFVSLRPLQVNVHLPDLTKQRRTPNRTKNLGLLPRPKDPLSWCSKPRSGRRSSILDGISAAPSSYQICYNVWDRRSGNRSGNTVNPLIASFVANTLLNRGMSEDTRKWIGARTKGRDRIDSFSSDTWNSYYLLPATRS
jgi:hypothetical protein